MVKMLIAEGGKAPSGLDANDKYVEEQEVEVYRYRLLS